MTDRYVRLMALPLFVAADSLRSLFPLSPLGICRVARLLTVYPRGV